jgi:hypothetical protein
MVVLPQKWGFFMQTYCGYLMSIGLTDSPLSKKGLSEQKKSISLGEIFTFNRLICVRVETMKRKMLSRKKSRKMFNKTANKTHKLNRVITPKMIMRGGIQL